jgi:carbon-monoxide dehydrogenase large subunit
MSAVATSIGGVGESVKRKEDAKFLQGRGNYVDDLVLPGMLHMAILRSPYAHARLKSIDTTAASAVPGVVAVVTGALRWQRSSPRAGRSRRTRARSSRSTTSLCRR